MREGGAEDASVMCVCPWAKGCAYIKKSGECMRVGTRVPHSGYPPFPPHHMALPSPAGGMVGAFYATNVGSTQPLGVDGWRFAFHLVSTFAPGVGERACVRQTSAAQHAVLALSGGGGTVYGNGGGMSQRGKGKVEICIGQGRVYTWEGGRGVAVAASSSVITALPAV